MLEIKRDSTYFDKLRSYRIELDGKAVDEIFDGETKRIAVEPGSHTLCLKVDWCSSKKIAFKVKQRKDVNFRCTSNLQGARALIGIVYAVFLPRQYIRLELDR